MAKEQMAELGTQEWHEQIAGAVARGWCEPKIAHKTMDEELAFAITAEIETLLRTDIHPKLGCATTRELFGEIASRLSIDMDYRTIDS